MAARTAADGVGAREWLEMGWEKKPLGMSELGWVGEKKPLGMSKLGCADGCRRRSCKEVVGNGWGEGEKKPLRMSELGCADGCGRRGCNGVAGGEAGNGEKKMLGMSELGCADGRGRGAREWLDMDGGEEAAGDERAWLRRMAVDGVGARGWLEMGGEKKRLGMSELGCADGCARRGCKGVGGHGFGEEAAGDQRAWLRRRPRTIWVQGSGWKWVREKKSCWGWCKEWLEMGGEKNRRWG